MPEITNQLGYDTQTETEENTDFQDLKTSIRAGFEDFMQVNFLETGFLSASEAASYRQYVESVLNNPNAKENDLQMLKEDYLGSFAQRMKTENRNVYVNEVLEPLNRALSNGVISADSYTEWLNWIRDPGRAAKEKKRSIASVLPSYLQKREALATKRNLLVKDARVQEMLNSSDATLKALATKVMDQEHFLNALSFSERTQAVTALTAALPLLTEEKAIFEKFNTQLESAVTEGLISGASKDRWIARFKDPAVNAKAKIYFVSSQFPSYVTAWRKVKKEQADLAKDETVKQLTTKDFKQIDSVRDEKKFLTLHYDQKVSLLSELRAAKAAHEGHKKVLHKETQTILQTAASAGYISSNKIGPWLEHVINGERTLSELKNFVKDWAKIRFRFDKIELTMTQAKAPQGLQRISLETFLNLSYAQRVSYVNETERRLQIETNESPNTAFQDAKGKVRHALDLENWEEAEHYLSVAWPLATNETDIHELQSMENYLKSFNKQPTAQEQSESKDEAIASAQKEITTILSLLPASLQSVYRKALAKGPECLQCVTTCVYNRTWCEERGFLNGAMEEELRKKSIQETQQRVRSGGEGHQNGLENNFVDGHNQPAIRDQGIGPQNLFMSGSGADAFVEKADANKNTFTFWYWTNLIVDGVSASQNSYVSYALNHRIKRAARKLDSYGVRYNPVAASSLAS